MTKEEIFEEVKNRRMTKFAQRMKVVNSDVLYEAMQQYSDQQSLSLQKELIELRKENEGLRAALKELVECKNLNSDSQSYMKTDHYYAYLRRFDTAWQTAIKALQPLNSEALKKQ